jgi:hypothetical protein
MANDFSGDSDVIALYNFEKGALTSDSKNSNTLTNNNSVAADLVNFKEGSASALGVRASDRFFDIADSSLQSDFPLKSGTSNTVFSILGWFRTINEAPRQGIINKYETDSRRSLHIRYDDRDISITMGYNNGDSFEALYAGSVNAINVNAFHHYKFTFNDGSWTLRIWNDTTSAVVLDVSGTASETITLDTAPWAIGSYRPDAGGNSFDGQLDETIFFKRIVSDADQDSIIAGTYTSGGATYNEAVAESIGLTETQANLIDMVAAIAESIGVAETQTALLDSPIAISESIGLAETQAGKYIFRIQIAEGIGLAEVQAVISTLTIAIVESIGLSDVQTSGSLATGKICVTISSKIPTITITGTKSSITITGIKPDITITSEGC